MITKTKEFPGSLAEERLSLRQALAQMDSIERKEPDPYPVSLSAEVSSSPVPVIACGNPKPDRTVDPYVKYFDLLIHGESVGFRGDTYRLIGSPQFPGKLLVNDKPLVVHEECDVYVARILNFVTFHVRMLTQGHHKEKREIGARLRVHWKHPDWVQSE